MRSNWRVVLLLGGALALGAPGESAAQTGDGWWEWALREVAGAQLDRTGQVVLGPAGDVLRGPADRDRDGDWDRDRDRDDDRDRDEWEDEDWDREGRRDRGEVRERGPDGDRGPPFCRNGEGHPVHGLEWCRRKGFGVYSRDSRWATGGWGDVVLRAPDRRQRTMGEGGLIDVLGDVIFGRLEGERNRLGGERPLEGRWLDLRGGGHVLQVRAGRVPVAELSDVDGDGRVDAVLIPRP